jgi:hypothetical protein
VVGLARALWTGGRDRAKAHRLATAAAATYKTERRESNERMVLGWLADHSRSPKRERESP